MISSHVPFLSFCEKYFISVSVSRTYNLMAICYVVQNKKIYGPAELFQYLYKRHSVEQHNSSGHGFFFHAEKSYHTLLFTSCYVCSCFFPHLVLVCSFVR